MGNENRTGVKVRQGVILIGVFFSAAGFGLLGFFIPSFGVAV